MKNNLIKVLMLTSIIISSAVVSGCGQATAGDAIDVLNSATIPSLNNFVATGSFTSGSLGAPFSASNPYWSFTNLSSGFGGNYIAPARAVVADIEVTTITGVTTTFVTLIHSSRLATRIYGIQNVSVRPGDYVVQGQIIGSFYTTGQQLFQVLLDGVAVCPLSYLSSTFRSSIISFNTMVCQ